MKLTSKQFLVIGFFLVLYGMVVPWLMVTQTVEPTFFLSLTSYAGSFVGLIFGVVGAMTYVREHRNRDQ
jgi:membrane associated rhomboid family serine protease